jgi:hypothetical protein
MSRRLSTFGSRFLAIAIAVVAVGFLCRSEQMRGQRQAVRFARHNHSLIVHYDYGRLKSSDALMHLDPNAGPQAPKWLRTLLGDEFLYDIAYLEVARPYPSNEKVDEFLTYLPDCPVIYR